MTEHIIIAALGVCVAALGYGWWRAEQRHTASEWWRTLYHGERELQEAMTAERDRLAAELGKLTDRDARGRFVKREGK